jgi:topoisomerase-4 subunit A
VLYFSRNPNGVGEVVTVRLRPRPKLKKLRFDFDFGELTIRGRMAKGNTLTKHIVSKIELKEKGASTLSARKIWYDEIVNRLNVDGRGKYLGEFAGDARILTVSKNGSYKLTRYDLSTHFDEDMLLIEKWEPLKPLNVVYFDGEKEQVNVKRFLVEKTDKVVTFITEHENSEMLVATTLHAPVVNIQFDRRSADRDDEVVNLREFIAVKGLNAMGNRLTAHKVKTIDLMEPDEELEAQFEQELQDEIKLEEARNNPEMLGLDDEANDGEADDDAEEMGDDDDDGDDDDSGDDGSEGDDSGAVAEPEPVAEKKPEKKESAPAPKKEKKVAEAPAIVEEVEEKPSEEPVTIEWSVGDEDDAAKPASEEKESAEKAKKPAAPKSNGKAKDSDKTAKGDNSQITLF